MAFSRFGQYLTQGAGIVQLMEDLGDAVSAPGKVRMLGGGNPAVIPDMQDYFRNAMQALLDDGGRFDAAVGNYDSPDGDIRFREALAGLLRRNYGWDIDGRNIAVTNGSQSTFFVLFNLFSGAYDDGGERKILLPLTPEYIGYSDAGLGREIFTANRPSIEHLPDRLFKYHVDFSTLTVDDSIGALCVSRPTNPTGNVLTDDEVDALRAACRARGIPLILDCAYGTPFPNIIFGEAKPVYGDDIILCMSLSKLGLPGVRTGIVVADEPVIRAICAANAILSLAPGSFGPALMHDAVVSGDIIRLSDDVVRPFYQRRALDTVAIMHEAFDGLPYRIHQPEGAIFLWLWLEGLPITSDELYRRLKARGVYVIAGEHFFPGLADDWPHRHECLRISYAGDPASVREGIAAIAEEARRAYG